MGQSRSTLVRVECMPFVGVEMEAYGDKADVSN